VSDRRRKAWVTQDWDDWSSAHPTMDVICDDEEHGLVFTGILDANGDPLYRDTTPERVEFGFHYYPPTKRRRRRKP
jgi:hypothetical protein